MINKSIAKLCGQPYNASSGTGGRKTVVGAGVNGSNGTIAGGHFLQSYSGYGVKGITEGMVKGG
jgi:hypothetical protein